MTDLLANVLGHEIWVHRQDYRLPEGTLQLAKVSKVLIAQKQGLKRTSLDQIQIDPKEEAPEVMDSDLSEMEAEKDSSFCSSSSGSSRSERRQLTTNVFGDDTAPIGSSAPKRRQETVESDSDDPKTAEDSGSLMSLEMLNLLLQDPQDLRKGSNLSLTVMTLKQKAQRRGAAGHLKRSML